MKNEKCRMMGRLICGVFVLMIGFFMPLTNVMAAGYGLTMSPMNQEVVLNPGDNFESSFVMANPLASVADTYYELSIEPFYFNDKNEPYFSASGDSGEMAEWITFKSSTSGKLSPNESKEIIFEIKVPETAPAGGQYAAIIATISTKAEDEAIVDDMDENSSGVSMKETKRVAHLIYAEITGNVIKKGEIMNADVSGFLFSGKIHGSSLIKNTGNVHSSAYYTMRVTPIFSNEEVFTNEEDPERKVILPDRTVYEEFTWGETPSIGIFNVVYTVEFEGSKAEVSKIVIVCPLWLLFLIIFGIAAIIIYFVTRAKARKKNAE